MIKRKIEDKIFYFIKNRKEYISILWPRQVWKTTILKKIESQFQNSIYLNFENFLNKNDFEKNPIWFINSFIKKWEQKIFLFDEFQLLENAWSVLKLIFDTFWEEIKIIISWSNALCLQDIWWKMTWRIINFEIFPFNTEEYFLLKSENSEKNLLKNFSFFTENILEKIDNLNLNEKNFQEFKQISFQEDIKNEVNNLIIYWWYPEIVKENNLEIKNILLENLVSNYLNRDIITLLKVKKINDFNNLVVLLSNLIWQQINISNIWNDIKLSSPTINEYINYLEKSYILQTIKPYSTNSINEIKKQNIQYFHDNWFRNFLIRNFNNLDIRWDNWHLLENYIFQRLNSIKNKFISINYRRDKKWNEMDFILKKHNSIIPIEIKFQNFKKPEFSKSFKLFFKKHKNIDYWIIITKNFLKLSEFENKKIYFIPYYLF